MIISQKPGCYIRNIFYVLFGRKTLVGYRITENSTDHKLPKIKPGILNPTDILTHKNIPSETIDRLNLLYARDYKIINDLNIIFKGFRNLGR
jgi:lipopolysaccharide/colanic/teichoic acid biosynthesis glycosyltransferase